MFFMSAKAMQVPTLMTVIFSQNWDEYLKHLKHLRKVFGPFHQAGLTIELKKCQFGQEKVHYLGHVVGGEEVQPELREVRAVQEYPTPTTKKDVRAFLGLVGYYQRFIPQFASIAAPLTDLTRKIKSQVVD